MLSDDKFLQALGKKIESYSLTKFKSQSEFALACDVDPRTVRRIIRAEQNPTVLVLRRIAMALEIELEELINLP